VDYKVEHFLTGRNDLANFLSFDCDCGAQQSVAS
jgi:hypothetical protein